MRIHIRGGAERMELKCFAKNLHNPGSQWGRSKLAATLAVNLFILLIVPAIAAFVPRYFFPLWPPPGMQTIVTIIKVTSIGLLSFHTLGFAPDFTYKCIAFFMFGVVAVLLIHAMHTIPVCPPGEILCEWVKSHSFIILYAVSILSFLYMPFFWIANGISMRSHRGHLGRRRFCQAFIYGVNVPSIIAFAVVLTIPLFTPDEPPEGFVSGAIAFVVFYSTAAALCVDYYAQPFLNAGPGDCVWPPLESSTARS